ncbi:hypothetical protein LguiA_017456 [Lonicera macranthoides]
MDVTSITVDLLISLTFLHIILSLVRSCKDKRLPPGPTPFPIIGNLLKLGDQPHKSLAELAKVHGPIMSLKLGSTPTVVISSSTQPNKSSKNRTSPFQPDPYPTLSILELRELHETIENNDVLDVCLHMAQDNPKDNPEGIDRTHMEHMFLTGVEACGYLVPKGAQVLVNAWAIGQDPTLWEDPFLFKPERFLGMEINVRDWDFELIPFGASQLPFAIRLVPVILGSMINSFDWKLDGGIEPNDLDMSEKFGITVQKAQPLRAIPTLVVIV